MDVLAVIFYLFLFSLLVTSISALSFRSKGPWGSYWSLFLIIFLFVWMTSIWVEPIGPIYYGLAWGPIIFIGILMAILLAAATPPYYRGRKKHIVKSTDPETEPSGTMVALDILFWITITILIVGIIAKYWA